jgi:hypothetical protein
MNARVNKQYQLKPKHARTNRRMGNVVDQAIAALPQAGIRKSAEYLFTMGVPLEVAVRTLVYPQRRRAIAQVTYGRPRG